MPTLVTSPQLESACTEMWADPVEVAQLLGNTEAKAETATVEATWVLWQLSGRKYHGYQCWEEDYVLHPQQNKFSLNRMPINTLVSIAGLEGNDVSGTATPITDYQWDGTYVWLDDCRIDGWTWETWCTNVCRERKVRVRYQIKPWLPPGADRVVKKLAAEYWKAREGEPCSLPDRIQSVTRQGVSWTILDPQDFLQFGRTGIGPIDAWIATSNRFGISRAVDSMYAPIVVRTEHVGCGESCT